MINCLIFADDLMLLASHEQGLQHAFNLFAVVCDQVGMKTSTKKDLLCFSRNPGQCVCAKSKHYPKQSCTAAGQEVQVPCGWISFFRSFFQFFRHRLNFF